VYWLLVVKTVPVGPVQKTEYEVGEFVKDQEKVPPRIKLLSPVIVERTGAGVAGAVALNPRFEGPPQSLFR
jgi:hypothetical protein